MDVLYCISWTTIEKEGYIYIKNVRVLYFTWAYGCIKYKIEFLFQQYRNVFTCKK